MHHGLGSEAQITKFLLNFYFVSIVVNFLVYTIIIVIHGIARDFHSLIMGGRNPLKEDLGLSRINILINPASPCVEPLIKCCQTVHIFVQITPISDIIPPAFHMHPQPQHYKSVNKTQYKFYYIEFINRCEDCGMFA